MKSTANGDAGTDTAFSEAELDRLNGLAYDRPALGALGMPEGRGR